MTKEQQIDWLCRLRSEIYVYMPKEWIIPMNNALDMVIKELDQEPHAQPEIVRCSQCKYAELADSEDSQDGYTCQFHRGSIWFSGSYCSWAERRQDG